MTGLSFLGMGVGQTSVIAAEPLIRRIINLHKKDPETGKAPQEAMVSILCVASILMPIGQWWYAWTCAPPVHWIWPILAGVPFGAGTIGIFIYANSYLIASYGIYAASASAGNTVARSLLGAALPLAAPTMYANLGPHGAGSLLGGLHILIIPIPFVFYKYGARIRKRSALIKQMRADLERSAGKKVR